MRLAYCYLHPCGHHRDGTPTAEGDLRRFDGSDFVDGVRPIRAGIPADAPIWWQVQTHKTEFGGANRLRYPTPREIGLIAWLLIGEGSKGLFFFAWTDQPPNWEGLSNPASAARLAAAASIARRLTPAIRRRLLGCDPGPNEFSVAGHYASTLRDRIGGHRVVVTVNRSTDPAGLEIRSRLGGYLLNLESPTVVPVGGTVSLGPLDGTIWLHLPA